MSSAGPFLGPFDISEVVFLRPPSAGNSSKFPNLNPCMPWYCGSSQGNSRNPLGISSEVFGFPTLVSSFCSRASVLDRVCLPPGDPLLVPDDSCSPGLVLAGSFGPGVIFSGSPGPLLIASASPSGSSAGCFSERFEQSCALCPFREQALQRFKTAFVLSSNPPASSSP
jgi:hypothetical protein